MKTLIIGAGEVGRALGQVLSDYEPKFIDPAYDLLDQEGVFDYLHICFPFSRNFIEAVRAYQAKYQPKYTIIHSTVPVGTSRALGAIFSPVVGLHPHLTTSLRTFTKFLAGEQASEVTDYFRRAGLKVYLFDQPETAELAKLSQTTFYALMVEYIKGLKRECDRRGLAFSEVYTLPSQDYNQGYQALGYDYHLPLLVPILKPQGGHCTIPNCDLWDNVFTQFIKDLNASLPPTDN